MNSNKGFVVKPEMYTQEKWCTLYLKIIEEYQKLQQENQQLKQDIEELYLIVGIRQKRNLIRKFDKEYDEEDKKKNPNRDYAGITPDAEEVYKRYYELKDRINKVIKYIEGHSKESGVKIYGIPECKIFMGSVEELLDLLKGDKEQ